MNKHSNILKISPFFDYFKDFLYRIKRSKDYSDAPFFNERNGENMLSSILDIPNEFVIETLCKEGQYQKRGIKEIDYNEDCFIIDLNVLDIFPKNVDDMVLVYCSSCLER